jgi:hypothetical protein
MNHQLSAIILVRQIDKLLRTVCFDSFARFIMMNGGKRDFDRGTKR